MHESLALSALLFMNGISHAQFNIPGIESTPLSALTATDNTLAKTGLTANEDDITADQDAHKLTLTEEQRHQAAVWDLSTDEEKRYVQLMQNRSGLYYEGLRQTPIDVLGINARNEAERVHFAELSARQEAQKVAKNIAWDNAFRQAYSQLFKDVPVIGEFDPTPFAPNNYKPVELKQNDTLYWFIKPELAVKTVLLPLLEAIKSTPNTRLHLMLLDTDDLRIQQWANLHQIPRDLVTQGIITINHGELSFDALTLKQKKIPLLLLARDGESRVVDLGRF